MLFLGKHPAGYGSAMSKTAIRYIAALTFAGASLLPGIAFAQASGGSGNGSAYTNMHYRMQWEGDQPYYYDQQHHRHNMGTREVRDYAKHNDRRWYDRHRMENDREFMHDWQIYYSNNGNRYGQ